MPKVSPVKPRALIAFFEKVGYIVTRQKGSHVIMYHKTSHKRLTIPLHTKELPNGTLLSIIKQAGLTKEKFVKFKKKYD